MWTCPDMLFFFASASINEIGIGLMGGGMIAMQAQKMKQRCVPFWAPGGWEGLGWRNAPE